MPHATAPSIGGTRSEGAGVPMKTLIVYAHPEPKSLNNSLKDLAVSTLETAGHEVRVSDLYAMNWKAVVDAADYGPEASHPLKVALNSGRAFDSRHAHPRRPRRAGEAAVGRHDHLPVPAVVVHDARDPQRLGGPGVHLPLRVRRRRAQRHQVRRALRRRHPRGQEGSAVGDRRMVRSRTTPLAGSTAPSTICCSRSTTASSTTRASRCCRRSCCTAPTG